MTEAAYLPKFLTDILAEFVDRDGVNEVFRHLRAPAECLSPAAMNAAKATRLSFARVLARRMIQERWRIERQYFDCGPDGDTKARYAIGIGQHRLTYVVRAYPWDGVEKIGRRADGVNRDMFSALFYDVPSDERIQREFAMFETRDQRRMRTESDVVGWNPANRSVRTFDQVVDELVAGRVPSLDIIHGGSGYILRNAGFVGSGRSGTISFEGMPAGHPLAHPYFADLFGLYMIRQVSIDLVNGIARARNPHAAQLRGDAARFVGVGNSSGQGMCVCLQRWPHWVSCWTTLRELALAHAASRKVTQDERRREDMLQRLDRVGAAYAAIQLTSEQFVTRPALVAHELSAFASWVKDVSDSGTRWVDLARRAAATLDRETAEQVNALLVEIYPEFADAISGYLPIGMKGRRAVVPEMRVGELKRLLRSRYDWALSIDLTRPGARAHFWYHSIDSGEQRRGDRGIDPHEHFESFTDLVGAIQRLAAVVDRHREDEFVGVMIADRPELAHEVSRIQFLRGLPYSEIRGDMNHTDNHPAYFIRFLLAVLGMEFTNPLSIRYVRGVFFQGMPLPDDIIEGASEDWAFPVTGNLAADAAAQ